MLPREKRGRPRGRSPAGVCSPTALSWLPRSGALSADLAEGSDAPLPRGRSGVLFTQRFLGRLGGPSAARRELLSGPGVSGWAGGRGPTGSTNRMGEASVRAEMAPPAPRLAVSRSPGQRP